MEALLVSYLRFCSGNGVHVPLHLDGVGAFQCDVERTGVVDGLLRRPCAAQHVQAGDHPGRQGDDQLRLGAVVLLAEVRPAVQQPDGLHPTGGLEAGVRVPGAALGGRWCPWSPCR